jgi:hypothetical protein
MQHKYYTLVLTGAWGLGEGEGGKAPLWYRVTGWQIDGRQATSVTYIRFRPLYTLNYLRGS